MSARDFLLLCLVCVLWGLNFVVTKWVVSGGGGAFEGVPPLFFAFVRMLGVAILLAPFLWPLPKRMGTVAAYALCLGAIHFGCLYLGVQSASPSAVAVVFPIYVPMTTILSVLVLGEVVRWRRGLGILLAAGGVAYLGFDPEVFEGGPGLFWILGAAASAAVGAVLNRRLAGELTPWQAQAWVGMLSWAPLLALTATLETGQLAAVHSGGVGFAAGLAYAIAVVGIFGHGVFFLLLSRNDATLVSPLSLMASVWGVLFAVVLLGDVLTTPMLIGGAATLIGCVFVAARPARRVDTPTGVETTAR